MATDVHADHMIADPWMDRIVEWLELEDLDDGKPMMRDCLHTHEVLHSALGHDLKNCSKRDEMRVASCLSALGYEITLRRVAGKPKRVWVRQPATTS